MEIKRIIQLNLDTPDSIYTDICNIMENQGVFVRCGSPDDKWIEGKWPDEEAYMAWLAAIGVGGKVEDPPSTVGNERTCPFCKLVIPNVGNYCPYCGANICD